MGATPERVLGTGAELVAIADEQGKPADSQLLVAVVTELESRSVVEYAVLNEIVNAS